MPGLRLATAGGPSSWATLPPRQAQVRGAGLASAQAEALWAGPWKAVRWRRAWLW